MIGGEALVRTLVASGVDVVFANPGTSEMHFVATLDSVPEMRGVLALFEGAATGAADGYARMRETPAAVLLHLGPGLGNGLANLHNARRSRAPVVAIVGDHATYHKPYDAPLESDIETVARNVSRWIRRSSRPEDAGADAAAAVAAACGPPGQVATLILPADVSWSEGGSVAAPAQRSPRATARPATLADAAAALRSGENAALLLGGSALRERGMRAASRIAGATGAEVLAETFPARVERGAGIPVIQRLAYLAEMAAGQLDGLRHLILVDTRAPVSFFAYPGKPSDLVPDGCDVRILAGGGDDAIAALESLADDLGADGQPALAAGPRPEKPTGELGAESVARAIGALLPEGTIVSDEANTSGTFLPTFTAAAPRHDWLTLTGGSIGQGLPVAVGAAIACPDRPVLALEADGSALYTLQALWTMAREELDVTTIIFSNRRYAILRMELARVGATASGRRALEMLDLSPPDIDFVALAHGFGVPATRPENADTFAADLERAFAEPGPHLIEVVIPSLF
ncbi:MAG TPA: acetolactate synthase large subunit [Candidatus Saccharimonadales bacterium]|nr:acetolactate synthase large subunit [Candidatus Saccharimonadales bacterium]